MVGRGGTTGSLPEVKELTTPPSGRSDDTLPGGHSQPKQAKIQHGELDMVTTPSSGLATYSEQTMPNGDGAPILEGGGDVEEVPKISPSPTGTT